MGQRVSRRKNVEEGGGGECVNKVNPCTPVTPTDHKAGNHPRLDETPVDIGEGGGGQEKGREKKKKRLKKKRFRRFASLFCCFSRPKSTRAQDEPVEQGEVDQDAEAGPSRRCSGVR
ncbi:hypothetical protein Q8A67_025592 [Cirrhinus molitorella]|uniref:Uncharacterized protein n=1 Tax=Cirrhinus molitorella TaxID=172907 RepID=A0AA88NXV7_9TELE|nr:hypothetical protein Q8A67_025592 [Cirrhinus molitorella]